MRFMGKDEALKTIHLLGAAAANEKISKSALKDWVVMLQFYSPFYLALICSCQ